MASKYEATLEGISLDLVDIEDSFSMSLGRYEYPFRNGAKLDPFGANAQTLRVRAYFLGERYSEYPDFVDLLNEGRLMELVHPAHGLLHVRAEGWNVRHDDRIDTAEIDISFVEQLIHDEPLASPTLVSTLEAGFEAAEQSLIDQVAADIRSAIADSHAIVTKALDPLASVTSQFSGVSRAARVFLAGVDSAVALLEGTLSSVANPAESLISTIEYGATLPGRIVSTIANCVERYSQSIETVVDSPTALANGMANAVLAMKAAAPDWSAYIALQAAIHTALVVGVMYADDEGNRASARSAEEALSFDPAGNYVRRSEPPALYTVNELERSLYSVRRLLQAAVEADRSNTAPKLMAAALLRHVNTVKLERDKIVTKDVSNTPLHVVCLRNGLPPSMADRVLSLNQSMPNPTFADGEVSIYVR